MAMWRTMSGQNNKGRRISYKDRGALGRAQQVAEAALIAEAIAASPAARLGGDPSGAARLPDARRMVRPAAS